MFLSQYGWRFRKSEEGFWETGWSCDKRSYPLSISTCETWVSFEVKPLLKLDLNWMEWPELSSLLLELNNTVHLVKLSLDEEDRVILTAQVFLSQLDYKTFQDTLGVLGHYTEVLFEQLLNHAIDIGAFGPSNQMLPA